jgi:hypothetical protein
LLFWFCGERPFLLMFHMLKLLSRFLIGLLLLLIFRRLKTVLAYCWIVL